MLQIVHLLEEKYSQLNFKVLYFSSHMETNNSKIIHPRLLLLPIESIKEIMWNDYHYCFINTIVQHKDIVETFIDAK